MFFFKNKAAVPANGKIYWFAGLHLSTNANKLETALVGLDGARPGSAILLKKETSFDLPTEIVDAFADLRRALRVEAEEDFARRRSSAGSDAPPSGTGSASALTQLASLRSMAATIQEEAIDELLAGTGVRRDEVVAAALNDPGVWAPASVWTDRSTNCALGSGALLAEKTGLNVVDSFLGKEAASRGQGSPVLAFPYWILFGAFERDALLVDLGATARWTYLPSSSVDKGSWARIRSGEIAPCGSLLDALTEQATKGEARIDVGGKLSVQGRNVPALLDFWRNSVREFEGKEALPPRYFSSPISKIPNETFFLERIRSEQGQKWSSLDALCAAVHWIAESVAAAIQEAERNFSGAFDVVLTGAATRNGLLFNRLSTLLAPRRFRPLSEYGFNDDSFDATAVAILGVLFAAGIPASLPGLNGAKRESLLGRVSPGAPENWTRFWKFRVS